jgi:hypothetical protein
LRSSADRLHKWHVDEERAGVGNLDLIDWTIETAKGLRAPHEPTAIEPVNGSDAPLKSDDWLLMPGADTGTATEQPAIEQPADDIAAEPAAHEVNAPSVAEPETIAAEPIAAEPVAAMPVAAEPPVDVHAPLLQAIVDPGIYTAKSDRHRAIDLRWILRDIAAGRLRTPAISELDLHILIDLKLVELRSGVPHLTNAGVTAIV